MTEQLFADAEWHEVLVKQRHVVAEQWKEYRGVEDNAHITARELAIGYLALESELTQAQADMEALRVMVVAYNAERNVDGAVFETIGLGGHLDRAFAALPEHLRGESR